MPNRIDADVLKQRVFSALLAVPLLCAAILYAPHWLYAGILSLVTLWAAVEWVRLVGFDRFHQAVFIVVIVCTLAVFFLPMFLLPQQGVSIANTELMVWACGLAVLGWLPGAIFVLCFQRFRDKAFLPYQKQWARYAVGFFLVVPFALGLWYLKLQEQGQKKEKSKS